MSGGLRRFLDDPVASWRSGTPQSQRFVLAVTLACVVVCGVISWHFYNILPLTSYYVWLLIGTMVLRFKPLVLLTATAAVAGFTGLLHSGNPIDTVRISAMSSFVICVVLILYAASRQRSGLPGPVGEAMLADLRDRLQAQSKIPPLPAGWRSQSAMISASGVGYGGDFMVVSLGRDRRSLEMILVDVCGKGVGAATEALQFAGALDGLIGSLPPQGLFAAANDFLLRQDSDETFATAAHVLVDLHDGSYEITSAGHPPALVWGGEQDGWAVDEARGMALGILPRPELHTTKGVLAPGQAVLFYTDGVIEKRRSSIDEGVTWLQKVAGEAVQRDFEGAARRILRRVERGDDDRAVLMLWRERTAVPVAAAPARAARA